MNQDLNRERIEVIREVCESLSSDDVERGRKALKEGYPFVPKGRHPRNYTAFKKFTIFLRDGFIDRYSGERLLFPGVLKVLSDVYPIEFPYHKNGKMTLGHMAYWHLLPTIDHVEPYAAGGGSDDHNLVTTSMLHNGMKSCYSMDELGWELHSPGNLKDWDGMTQWFYDHLSENKELLADKYVSIWYKVLLRSGRY